MTKLNLSPHINNSKNINSHPIIPMSTTISYQTIESRLHELHENTSAPELGYDLLRIFNGMSETRINRIKDGKDNLSKESNAIVVKKLLAYTHCATKNLAETLESLKQDAKVLKRCACWW